MILFTLFNVTMSVISLKQFEQFAEDYPELAQCYDLTYINNTKDAVDADVQWAFGEEN